MLPWLWNGGRERNPEKLAGHRGKLLSSRKEVVQDCVSLVSPWPLQTNCPTSGAAQLCPAARHRAVLQWHTLPSTYICIIKKTQPTQNQNTAFPPRLTPFFYFLWMTKKITLCTQARNMVCKKKINHIIKTGFVFLKCLYPMGFLFSLKQEPAVSLHTALCASPKLSGKN